MSGDEGFDIEYCKLCDKEMSYENDSWFIIDDIDDDDETLVCHDCAEKCSNLWDMHKERIKKERKCLN